MKVLFENFTENIRDQIPNTNQFEHRHTVDAPGGEILQTIKIRAEIKNLALTLYHGESKLVSCFFKNFIFFHKRTYSKTVRRALRDENSKLANIQIEMIEALYRQQSDSSYKAMARVKNFLFDDLRETNKSTSVTRIMDRHFTLDPNVPMLVLSFELKPTSSTNSLPLRQRKTKISFF